VIEYLPNGITHLSLGGTNLDLLIFDTSFVNLNTFEFSTYENIIPKWFDKLTELERLSFNVRF